MTAEQILYLIISSLCSGLVGICVSTYFYVRYERRKDKLNTLRGVIGNRYDLQGDEFSRAINEIVVIFAGSPKVMKALAEHHEKVVGEHNSEDALLKLFKAMCDDVRLVYNEFNDSFFLKPYNTRLSSKKSD